MLDTSCTIPDRVAKSPKSQTRKIWARPGVVKLSTQKLFPSLELCLAPLLVSFLLLLFLDLLPRLQASQNLVLLPLRPYEIVILPIVVVAHAPPEARF